MPGFVYLICNPDLNTYKIGVTRDLTLKRLKSLQTANSSELYIVKKVYTQYPFRLETLLHNKFKHKKALGEWFYLSNTDVNNFDKICNNLINIIDIMKNNPYFNKDLK